MFGMRLGAGRNWLLGMVIGLGLTFSSPGAQAHLLPAQTATMNLVGANAYFVVSVPVSTLSGIDDDKSGGVSALEVARHNRDIALQFNRRFHVSADGKPAIPLMTMAWSPQTEGPPSDAAYVVVLHGVQFEAPPLTPLVETDLFGTGPNEGQMILTAKRNKKEDTAEVAILRPDAGSHQFFRSGLAIFADFVRIGVEHILTGPDHLLFLLTILIGAAGARYWISVVTSFTIAHSITLTLAALKLVQVPGAITEPAIAASILIMACLNLWGSGIGLRVHGRIAIVFACGLLHGLGFATALGGLMANSAHRLASLAGFNIGIELGQFIFLGGLLLIGGQLRRVRDLPFGGQLPRLASMSAAILACIMLFNRVLPEILAAHII